VDIFGLGKRFAGDKLAKNDVSSLSPTSVTARPEIPGNIERLHDAFTTTEMSNRSGGAIDRMDRAGASGLIGNFAVETGDSTLTSLDAVEGGNGQQGRGMSQYSWERQGPYLAARDQHLQSGGDANSPDFQLQYLADEYSGKHDPAPGRSLSGWRGTLSGETDGMSVPDAAVHIREDFFAPSTPHDDRRISAAQAIDDQIQQRDNRLSELSAASGLRNSSMAHVGHRGVDGNYWAGDDYAWQSPESFKQLMNY